MTEGGFGISGVESCTVESDFYDTALIIGISLADTSGNPLDASITFASGTDYNAIAGDNPSPSAVPGPSALVLLGSGLAGLAELVPSPSLGGRPSLDGETQHPTAVEAPIRLSA